MTVQSPGNAAASDIENQVIIGEASKIMQDKFHTDLIHKCMEEHGVETSTSNFDSLGIRFGEPFKCTVTVFT